MQESLGEEGVWSGFLISLCCALKFMLVHKYRIGRDAFVAHLS